MKCVIQLQSYFPSFLPSRKLSNFKPKERFPKLVLDQLLPASSSTLLERRAPRFPRDCTRHLPHSRPQQLAGTRPSPERPASRPRRLRVLALPPGISGEPPVRTHARRVRAPPPPPRAPPPSPPPPPCPPRQRAPRPALRLPAGALGARRQDRRAPGRRGQGRARRRHQRYLSLGRSLPRNRGHRAELRVRCR